MCMILCITERAVAVVVNHTLQQLRIVAIKNIKNLFVIRQETESVEESAKGEESAKEATRKTRMNVAMAAIMRKQEETNKQVNRIV